MRVRSRWRALEPVGYGRDILTPKGRTGTQTKHVLFISTVYVVQYDCHPKIIRNTTTTRPRYKRSTAALRPRTLRPGARVADKLM